MSVALAVFVVSYALIAGTRIPGLAIDRPAGALVGAVAMVVLGVVTPREAVAGIDADTLLLLFGMMVVAAYFTEAKALRWLSWLTLTHVHSPRKLLVALVVVAATLSALLVNDTVCLVLTPLVVQLVVDAKLPAKPYLLALAFGANAGSVATPTGNPQNMLVATLSGIGYAPFTKALALPAAVSVALVAVVLVAMCARDLPARTSVDPRAARPELDAPLATMCLVTLAGLLAAFFAGLPMSWTALAGASFLLVAGRRDPRELFARVDFVLLVFFAGLFVIVAAVGHSGLAEAMYRNAEPAFGRTLAAQAPLFGLFTVVASQVVSNVPFVLLAARWMPHFANPPFMWLSTALFATLAGNLTVVGSVANVIVVEGAKEHGRFSFGEFLKYGAAVTLATLVGGYGVLWLEHLAGLV